MIESRIYDILLKQSGYMKTEELDSQLGVSARELRAHGDEAGMIERASEWIFKTHGMVIIRRMSPGGLKLSRSIEEIAAAKEQWNSHHWSVKKIVDHYDDAIRRISSSNKSCEQLDLLGACE